MSRHIVILVIVCLSQYVLSEEILKVTARDSYLDAYNDSHNDRLKSLDKGVENPEVSVTKTDRNYNVEPFYPGPSASDSFAPSPQYGPPAPQYGPPSAPGPQYGPPSGPGPQYGSPPAPQYGPPLQPQYGPPGYPESPKYGPSHPPPAVYGPPSHQSVQVYYGMPHAMLSLWDKLKLKLDLFTVGKILLKLVIFKKIVSLIAILCLLLFIPSLKHKVDGGMSDLAEDDSIMRKFGVSKTGKDSVDNVTTFVLESIENFGKKDRKLTPSCGTTYCKTQKALKNVEKKYSYKKLTNMYLSEL